MILTVTASPPKILRKLPNFEPIVSVSSQVRRKQSSFTPPQKMGSANDSKAPEDGVCWLMKTQAKKLILIKGVPFAAL